MDVYSGMLGIGRLENNDFVDSLGELKRIVIKWFYKNKIWIIFFWLLYRNCF